MHPTEATPAALPAPIELQIEHGEEHVSYLTSLDRSDPGRRWSHVKMGAYDTKVSVTRFTGPDLAGSAPALTIAAEGAFHVQLGLAPAELRLLATALCAAADDAEAAAPAASVQ